MSAQPGKLDQLTVDKLMSVKNYMMTKEGIALSGFTQGCCANTYLVADMQRTVRYVYFDKMFIALILISLFLLLSFFPFAHLCLHFFLFGSHDKITFHCMQIKVEGVKRERMKPTPLFLAQESSSCCARCCFRGNQTFTMKWMHAEPRITGKDGCCGTVCCPQRSFLSFDVSVDYAAPPAFLSLLSVCVMFI